jgi:hypothetical protein
MKTSIRLLAVMLMWLNFGAAHSCQRVSFYLDNYNYQQALAKKLALRLDTSKPIDFLLDKATPMELGLVEWMVLAMALHASGSCYELEVVRFPNPARASREMKAGRLDIQVLWGNAKSDSVTFSDPYIPKGTLFKGLYVSEANHSALALTTQFEVRRLSVGTVTGWNNDLQVLKGVGFSQIEVVPKKENLYKMLFGGRFDATMDYFTNQPGLRLSVGNGYLLPIPGFKVVMPESRHFAVTKLNPENVALLAAINRGLAKLRGDKSISAVMSQTGLINPAVKNWVVLNK